MSQPLRLHIGHHIMAVIETRKLIVGLDCNREQIIWSGDAPEVLRRAILEFVEDQAEETDD